MYRSPIYSIVIFLVIFAVHVGIRIGVLYYRTYTFKSNLYMLQRMNSTLMFEIKNLNCLWWLELSIYFIYNLFNGILLSHFNCCLFVPLILTHIIFHFVSMPPKMCTLKSKRNPKEFGNWFLMGGANLIFGWSAWDHPC